MIRKEFFEDKMREALTLLNARMSKQTVDAMYERLRYYSEDALVKALIDVCEEGNINYPNLLKAIRSYVSIDMTEEELERWQERKNMISQAIWEKEITKDGCIGEQKNGVYLCSKCGIENCTIMGKEMFILMKAIMMKEEQVVVENIAKTFDIFYDLPERIRSLREKERNKRRGVKIEKSI